jgi:hypothetical protein
MTSTGKCLCGAVTIVMSGEPLSVVQCWCRQCQTLAAGGPTHSAIFKSEDVTITGALARGSYVAASGNAPTAHFCAACGTQICGLSSAAPDLMAVRLGTLDPPHGLKPRLAIWTREAPKWAVIDPALEQFAEQPLPPPPANP